MIDKCKRKTLKKLAVGTGVVSLGGVSFAADAGTQLAEKISTATDGVGLGNIEVTTRVSAIQNDIEVVLTNAGRQTVNITELTPHTIDVARGNFDFSSLLKDGPLKLAAGQSVSIPLQRKPMQLNTPMPPAMATLSQALQKSMSVVTDNNAFASVTVKTAVGIT